MSDRLLMHSKPQIYRVCTHVLLNFLSFKMNICGRIDGDF